MPNNIYAAIEQLGLSAQNVPFIFSSAIPRLTNKYSFSAYNGTHELNAGIELQLLCLSTSAHIPLKQFIGSQVAVDIVTEKSELNRISGIITKADVGASDGALTIYRLTVEDPTALWKHRRNSRVFMAKSVVEVVQTIFAEWQQRQPLICFEFDFG